MDINISLIPYADWKGIIHDVIAVRTSAYFDWNGPRTGAEQKSEAGFWLERWALRRDATLFAARQNGQMVGYLLADERERSEYYLSHMGVHGDFKGQGIGRALIRRYEKEARDRGYLAITTTTYNRYKGMLVLLLQEDFYIQGTTWIKGANEPRLYLRKELTV